MQTESKRNQGNPAGITQSDKDRIVRAGCKHSMRYRISLQQISEMATGEKKNLFHAIVDREELTAGQYKKLISLLLQAKQNPSPRGRPWYRPRL